MFILLVGIGGPFFATQNYRMIWLGAFLAIGIHFIPFAAVHEHRDGSLLKELERI